jgi:dihydrofolate reductase
MRKIIVGAQVSLDGVMQAPGGPTEDPTNGFKFGGWAMAHFSQEGREELDRLFSEKFDLLLGRKTYEIFAAYWPYYDEDAPHGGVAKLFNGIKKYVVSRVGRGRYELAGLGAPARHCRREASAAGGRPEPRHPRQHRTRACAARQRPRCA